MLRTRIGIIREHNSFAVRGPTGVDVLLRSRLGAKSSRHFVACWINGMQPRRAVNNDPEQDLAAWPPIWIAADVVSQPYFVELVGAGRVNDRQLDRVIAAIADEANLL